MTTMTFFMMFPLSSSAKHSLGIADKPSFQCPINFVRILCLPIDHPKVAALYIGRSPQEFHWIDDFDLLESPQRKEMFLVSGHYQVRLGGQGAFQYHLVARIRGCSPCSLYRKDQGRGFRQSRTPFYAAVLRVFLSSLLDGLMILGDQLRAHHGLTFAIRPSR